MKHKIILLLAFVLAAASVYAQQAEQYSQYMFNQLVINPAYCGARDNLSATLLAREQWIGLPGRPSTQSFSLHAPTRNQKHGLGLAISNDKLGVTRDVSFNGIYAYRIHLGEKARLSMGLQGTLTNYRSDLSGVATGEVGVADPAFVGNDINLWIPNAGAGLWFNTERFYLGASIPKILTNTFGDDNTTLEARQYRHFFITSGVVIPFGSSVQWKPSVMVKSTQAAPFAVDLNSHLLFKEKVWLGASYRIDDAVVLMAEWQISSMFRIGYAYDINISALNPYNSGTHEFMLGMDLNFDNMGMVSPRYF